MELMIFILISSFSFAIGLPFVLLGNAKEKIFGFLACLPEIILFLSIIIPIVLYCL